ncbi:DNA/RNA non-specific endonuclease [Nonlabens ponticola]|uniref:Endonuclease n=1 Tax=Nonlabens ponticola TaxID=2496866 RepID=A0A3S9MWJ5_9FLAO|nr:DNA/RNA non-specific endonuclease [Nonlabens ponticola]AZQ43606.1 DNA/RNA non-specific endonuclease [Nonlabens ponticola]
MKKILTIIIVIGLIVGMILIEDYQNEAISKENFENQRSSDLDVTDYLPSSTNQVIHHKSYSLSYNERHEQAEWTAHVLRPSDIQQVDFKRPYFEIDDQVSTGAASWRNYKNSGYDRGHLVPAGDRRGSIQDFNETFLTSNISPQLHEFNAGIWNDLEQQVRRYAQQYGDLYIVTGSILGNNLSSIGNENVTVPRSFYKIILRETNDQPVILAYLLSQDDQDTSLNSYLISVDQIETMTGTDFFAQLPHDIEEKLEAQTARRGW